MAADEVFKTRIEGIAAGGAGLAKLRGKNIFIEGCAAGELVVCRVSEEHRSWARAELVEIIEPSPDRMPPACALYGLCGGCNLQHLRYEAQLAAKSVILQDAFMWIGGCSAPQPLVFPSRPWEYRNRMQLHRLGSCQRGTGFGLKGRRSGEVTAIPDCPAADPGIRELLRKTAQGETVIPLPPEKNRVTVYARQGLLLNEGGTRRGLTRLLGQDLALDAGVFFQSNAVMLEQLIADLRELAIGGAAGDASGGDTGADRNRAMADLFCGVGTFARFLAPFFPRSDLVEENKTALALARENLAGCEAEFFALRDDDWVKTKSGGKTRAGPAYGFIVVDPPRQGLSPALSTWLAAEGPPLLAYVSCDPATLARDSGILVRGGYEIAELRLYDFYPQTAHIESLAVFRKKIL